MPAPQYQYQLYELDRIEAALKSMLALQVSSATAPVQVLMKRETVSDVTPRVELVLKTQQITSQRFLLNPAKPDMRYQPLNTWQFILTATVVTNRSTNGDQHLPLCGKVRYGLQMYRLLETWPEDVDPYHFITDIQEAPIELEIENDENLDRTVMNFTGMLGIKDSAWR